MTLERLLALDLSELSRINPEPDWSLGTLVAAACLLEAAAPKAGNVHPGTSFADMSYEDFRKSACAIAPLFDDSSIRGVGDLILQAVEATRQVVSVNTNLGIILLTAPLAHCRRNYPQFRSFSSLPNLTDFLQPHDSFQIYRAIQSAKAGGLGKVDDMDVQATPPDNILDAMQVASAWDDIAFEYVHGFAGVFRMADRLDELRTEADGDWLEAVCRLQVERLADRGDTLIARKNGPSIVEEVKRLALAVLQTSTAVERTNRYAELDAFLRADGHRRNPGTTADLLAAATLIALIRLQ